MLQPTKSQYGQPTSNVTQPSRTTKTVNSKVNPKFNAVSQQSTQTAAAARSTQPSQSQRPALGIVPKNADLENRNSGRVSGLFYLALTKVNAVAETLGQKQKIVAC